MRKLKRKQESGITLIALVITIIVLLILAGVAISMLTGENGILKKATNSRLKTENGVVKENVILVLNEYQMHKRLSEIPNSIHAIKYLQGIVAEEGATPTITAKKFMEPEGHADTYKMDISVAAPGISTGKGETYRVDQYLVEKKTETEYILKYYADTDDVTDLLEIGLDGTSKELDPETSGGNTDPEPVSLSPGLYDLDGNLLKSWDALVASGQKYRDDGTSTEEDEKCYAYVTEEDENKVLTEFYVDSSAYDVDKYHLVLGNVNTIGYDVFKRFTELSRIDIPDSVTTIDGDAFFMCTGLTSLTLPNSVTSIGGSAFQGCTGITNLTLSNGLETIEEMAFDGCTGLTSLTIPESVTTIRQAGFGSLTGLTTLTVPETVEYIDADAFSGCTGLESITFPKAGYNTKIVDILGGTGNRGYNNLNVTITGGTSITTCEFYNFYDLASVTLPNTLETIESQAFVNTGLTEINIPETVTSIGNEAFYGCDKLTSITIPISVRSIGRDAFYECNSLTTVNYRGNQEQWNSISIYQDDNSNESLINANKVWNYTEPMT